MSAELRTEKDAVYDPTLTVRRCEPDGAVLEFAGTWLSQRGLPEPAITLGELRSGGVRHLAFDAVGVTAWDSGLVTFVLEVLAESARWGVASDRAGLPNGVRRLVALAEAVPERQTGRGGVRPPWLVRTGRTGAAFAAQLGTMNTNQEIDALSTLGISPMEFLVLPRMLALIAMMPLLTIYSDVVGILGGAVVGIGMLGLGPTQYLEQTRDALHVSDFLIGIAKSVVFGVVVALAGCLRGMQSGRSAAAVGLAATSAVVTSIVCLIVLDGIFAVILNVLGL